MQTFIHFMAIKRIETHKNEDKLYCQVLYRYLQQRQMPQQMKMLKIAYTSSIVSYRKDIEEI